MPSIRFFLEYSVNHVLRGTDTVQLVSFNSDKRNLVIMLLYVAIAVDDDGLANVVLKEKWLDNVANSKSTPNNDFFRMRFGISRNEPYCGKLPNLSHPF